MIEFLAGLSIGEFQKDGTVVYMPVRGITAVAALGKVRDKIDKELVASYQVACDHRVRAEHATGAICKSAQVAAPVDCGDVPVPRQGPGTAGMDAWVKRIREKTEAILKAQAAMWDNGQMPVFDVAMVPLPIFSKDISLKVSQIAANVKADMLWVEQVVRTVARQFAEAAQKVLVATMRVEYLADGQWKLSWPNGQSWQFNPLVVSAYLHDPVVGWYSPVEYVNNKIFHANRLDYERRQEGEEWLNNCPAGYAQWRARQIDRIAAAFGVPARVFEGFNGRLGVDSGHLIQLPAHYIVLNGGGSAVIRLDRDLREMAAGGKLAPWSADDVDNDEEFLNKLADVKTASWGILRNAMAFSSQKHAEMVASYLRDNGLVTNDVCMYVSRMQSVEVSQVARFEAFAFPASMPVGTYVFRDQAYWYACTKPPTRGVNKWVGQGQCWVIDGVYADWKPPHFTPNWERSLRQKK